MAKAIVLLSGGIDSTTCLAMAKTEYEEVEALSIHYGQKHEKEIEQAKKISDFMGVEHDVLEIPPIPNSLLTDSQEDVPNISYDDIEGVSPTYVPFRNGLMLSNITAIAQGKGCEGIYFGAHSEDARNWAYPDCTPEFIGAMANAIFIGTYQQNRLHTPLQWLKKHEIIQKAHELGAPLSMTWSCYKGEDLHCGICPTCRARKQAFEDAGVPDPTAYSE